ncbi:MAG TPA: tRNA uridine-5-carboxymethylaminomethyl(34) synthesis GTPase MnmE [Opitutae bacterium]|nr:tRNA uridine-5-carboxymethylaminomethyl(34) synthesis GTPase MnmE [Opitutae bacterium]
MKTNDTIVALSTPWGVSGIGVIRLSGPLCFSLAQAIFKRTSLVPRQAYYGHYYMLNHPDTALDEVVFVLFVEHASYTGEAMLELSCHGNPIIIQQIVRDCIQRGCRQAEPGEFTRRAFTNGVLDLCQAEAVEEVIHAQSLQALHLAQKQLGGALSQKVTRLVALLSEQIAKVEAYLDFPEEDLPEQDRQALDTQLKELAQDLQQLIQAHAAYAPLHKGIQVVIAGQPNAGKSTLLNGLLGRQRVLVSEIPGTTRDYVTERYALNPYVLTLIDTAGLRASEDVLERMGIEQTYTQLQTADMIIWVVDGSQSIVDGLKELQPQFPHERTLVLLNKADLGVNPAIQALLDGYTVCSMSLTDAEQLPKVQSALRHFLQTHYADPTQVAFMVNERHAEAFRQAQRWLMHAQSLLQTHAYDDCLAADLKSALRALEAVVGRVDYEQILDVIFSKFCIGK